MREQSDRDAGPGHAPPGMTIYSHFSTPTGLAVAARGTASAAAAAGIPVQLAEFRPGMTDPPTQPITVLHTNPDIVLHLIRKGLFSADRLREGRFTIGCWAFDGLDILPEGWAEAIPLVDEVWAPSTFSASAGAPLLPVPVVPMPLCVAPVAGPHGRADFGIEESAFVFLFVFDANGTIVRKNPQGVIQAFVQAFPVPEGRIRLVLKTRAFPEDAFLHLQRQLAVRPDIRFVNETWSDPRTKALIAACDCYISLHRAEGFGLTMAEAMYFGKPVIATGYSGNLDFTLPENSHLVPYRWMRLEQQAGALRAGMRMAEPDVDAAARLMRRVVERPAESRALGARAAAFIRDQFSAQAVGARIRARVELLQRSGRLDRR
ncbi:glycosyl transferase [Allostella vacuolata]|nr:glycosyl transferase [Stella vacuolata]